MTRKKPVNIGASVRQRLLNMAREDKRPFNELLQYYAMERFLYRLSCSQHVDKFVLKGALLLMVWQFPQIRATMDIDMLGRNTGNELEGIVDQIRDLCTVAVVPDGLEFDLDSIRAERITEDADYEGIRVHFLGMLDTARITMQVDIGFGDIIVPGSLEAELPAMLDFPAPRLHCYSMESVIAEKFEAMVKLGELNSRMKDFFDIWLFARQFDFAQERLCLAIASTMENRGTTLPKELRVFSDDFIQNKSVQWIAFRKRLKQDAIPADFAEVIGLLKDFLEPLIESIRSEVYGSGLWKAPGPWKIVKAQFDG